jgi:hypothetical protein
LLCAKTHLIVFVICERMVPMSFTSISVRIANLISHLLSFGQRRGQSAVSIEGVHQGGVGFFERLRRPRVSERVNIYIFNHLRTLSRRRSSPPKNEPLRSS